MTVLLFPWQRDKHSFQVSAKLIFKTSKQENFFTEMFNGPHTVLYAIKIACLLWVHTAP